MSGMVWLASYPKSGNTWLRVVFANLLRAGDGPASINELRHGLVQMRIEKGQKIPTAIEFESPAVVVTV